MNRIDKKEFAKKTLLGGLVILLPVALLAMGFRWLYRVVTDLIQPLTNLVTKIIGMPEIFADVLVLVGMAGLCFCVGWLVTTAGGAWFHLKFDNRLARYAPGYQMMKDIVGQFFGDASKSPFANGEVAMVRLFGDDSPTEVTAIVTSKHEDGRYTVFMPTGPNPTSGNIYHVKEEQVTLYPELSVSEAMRTIIACGAGTGDLLSNTGAVGSNVRKTDPEQSNAKKRIRRDTNEANGLSQACQDFLAANGISSVESLMDKSYPTVTGQAGFEQRFVKEMTAWLSSNQRDANGPSLSASDWLPIEFLGLGKKMTDTLNAAGYFCKYELATEDDANLSKVSGLGPKTLARLREQLQTLTDLEK